MNRKISIGLAITLIIVAATISFAITMKVSRQMYNKLIVDLPDKIAEYEVVKEVDDLVRNNYIDYDNLKQDLLNNGLAEGYMNGLDNQTCSFMTAKEYKLYTKNLEGKIPGIGITHTQDTKTGYMKIIDVASNSPADGEGLEKGDEITKINNEAVNTGSYSDLAADLEGDSLKTVDITYRRNGKDKSINVMIGYPAQSVYYEAINNIGYVKIRAFYKNTLEQFNKAINELEKQKVESLIFDVRNNSEGDLNYATDVIDAIVPVATEGREAIVTLYDKENKVINTIPSDAAQITLPIIVLVNSKTSGNAELFAQDLIDFRGYDISILGEETAGNWTKQEVFRLKDGNAIMMPVAKIMPYISDPFEGEKDGPIVPEIIVSLTPEQEKNIDQLEISEDPQIQAAYDILKNPEQ